MTTTNAMTSTPIEPTTGIIEISNYNDIETIDLDTICMFDLDPTNTRRFQHLIDAQFDGNAQNDFNPLELILNTDIPMHIEPTIDNNPHNVPVIESNPQVNPLSTRTFGIEIELISTLDKSSLRDAITDNFVNHDLNFNAISRGYCHSTDGSNVTDWELKHDGTIRNDNTHIHGIEVVSPVLTGQTGLNAVRSVCEVLSGDVTTSNKSCGFHVHHGVDNWVDVEKIAKLYDMVENVLFQGQPRSRQNNRFCKKWGTGSVSRKITRSQRDRYFGLNLNSYAMRKTVEFRLHSGTVDFDKISSWVLLTQLIVDTACTKPLPITPICNMGDLTAYLTTPLTTVDQMTTRVLAPSTRSKVITELNTAINAGTLTKPELITYICERNPEFKRVTVVTYLTDGFNPNYCRLTHLLTTIDGIVTWLQPAVVVDETQPPVNPLYTDACNAYGTRIASFNR